MKRNNPLRNHSIIIITGLFLMVMASCGITKNAAIDTKDLSYLYNPTKTSFRPGFSVYNESDYLSVLTMRLPATSLFFSEANPRGIPVAQIMVTVKLYNITGGRILADTAFIDLDIIKEEGRLEYLYKLPLKVGPGLEYNAEVKILDQLRAEVVQSFVAFNTVSPSNKYNYIVRSHTSKNELPGQVIRPNQRVNLLYPKRPPDSLFISVFKPLSEVPYPPSILLPEKTIDYDPDTIIALSYSDTLPLMFPDEGVYFCTPERELEDGFTFLNFGPGYPAVNDPLEMIRPLAYLASEEEMNTMLSSERPKLALDDFWLKCGGNVDRSRELIRIFYTRVLYANYYFTSFKEGWRTERGMIYTIYGPPDKVYKNSEEESWGYRRPVLKSSWGGRVHLQEQYLFFNFKIRKSRFSDNDFYLSRSETLVSYWDRAVASWRSGLVFRLDNPEDL
ncbi:MAG: GWxTD domain-containing protein [Bacteroidales bacterium]|nr:GWxTD domain-containing protein [Bacteroidales bacterium]